MKQSLKIASFLLAIVILGNSIGVAVFEHTCNYNGKSNKTFFKSHACCDVETALSDVHVDYQPVFKKRACCDTDNGLLVLDLFSGHSHTEKSVLADFTIEKQTSTYAVETISTLEHLLFSDCSGPPLSVRTSLFKHFSVYII
jgi:hypothetical protein